MPNTSTVLFRVVNEHGETMGVFLTREDAEDFADECDAEPETGHDPESGGYTVIELDCTPKEAK